MIGYFFRVVDLGTAPDQLDVLDKKLESEFDVVVCTGYGNVFVAGDYGWSLDGVVAGGLGGRGRHVAARGVEMSFSNADGHGFVIGVTSFVGSGCSFGSVADLFSGERKLPWVSISYFIDRITAYVYFGFCFHRVHIRTCSVILDLVDPWLRFRRFIELEVTLVVLHNIDHSQSQSEVYSPNYVRR
jgi:hypothetical protein